MSHTVTIKTQVRDASAIEAACRRLRLAHPVFDTHRIFSGSYTGIGVRLPNWHYPVICDTKSGELHYDNYGERWGKQCELDKFTQAYAVEKARIEARKLGHNVSEARQSDGSIVLTINT